MVEDLPVKFASLTGGKVPTNEVKLEKREKLENHNDNKKDHDKESHGKKNNSEDSGNGILDRIKPRPNVNKVKKVKETTDAGAENGPSEGTEDKPKRDPAKTRCNRWPTCKEQDCPYVHPNQQVS